ncbi:hypothetical protein DBR28_12775, partial [Chryseobacterium sp. HMWF028]
LLLFAMSYYGFESSYTRLKTLEKTQEFLFSSVYTDRVISTFMSVHATDFIYSLSNDSCSLQFLALLNIFILPYEN